MCIPPISFRHATWPFDHKIQTNNKKVFLTPKIAFGKILPEIKTTPIKLPTLFLLNIPQVPNFEILEFPTSAIGDSRNSGKSRALSTILVTPTRSNS